MNIKDEKCSSDNEHRCGRYIRPPVGKKTRSTGPDEASRARKRGLFMRRCCFTLFGSVWDEVRISWRRTVWNVEFAKSWKLVYKY